MRTFLFIVILLSMGFIPILGESKLSEIPLQQAPQAGVEANTTPQTEVVPPKKITYPVRLIIPSIKIDDQIVKVGVTDNGEMDVPDGKTKNIGWYMYGTVPGEVGSAVLDAHVFAAFKSLHNLKQGSDIYVIMSDGEKLH